MKDLPPRPTRCKYCGKPSEDHEPCDRCDKIVDTCVDLFDGIVPPTDTARGFAIYGQIAGHMSKLISLLAQLEDLRNDRPTNC